MNKLLVSLLLTLGVSGIAQAAGAVVVGDAAAGQAWPLRYVQQARAG